MADESVVPLLIFGTLYRLQLLEAAAYVSRYALRMDGAAPLPEADWLLAVQAPGPERWYISTGKRPGERLLECERAPSDAGATITGYYAGVRQCALPDFGGADNPQACLVLEVGDEHNSTLWCVRVWDMLVLTHLNPARGTA